MSQRIALPLTLDIEITHDDNQGVKGQLFTEFTNPEEITGCAELFESVKKILSGITEYADTASGEDIEDAEDNFITRFEHALRSNLLSDGLQVRSKEWRRDGMPAIYGKTIYTFSIRA